MRRLLVLLAGLTLLSFIGGSCAGRPGPLPVEVEYMDRVFVATKELLTDSSRVKATPHKYQGHAIYLPIDPVQAFNSLYLRRDRMTFVRYDARPDMIVRKPNIYIYPSAEQEVAIELRTPGRIVASEPAYGGRWTVRAGPDGLIDGAHRFLSYEVAVRAKWQTATGWVFPAPELPSFLKDLLHRLGFTWQEAEEFAAYWSPLLSDAPFYAVCPQDRRTIESAVQVVVKPRPDSLLRAWFCFVPLDTPVALPAPRLEQYPRQGFAVVEWGGLIIEPSR